MFRLSATTLRGSYNCFFTQKRHFASKFNSDDALLKSILSEERDSDLPEIQAKDHDINVSYRRASPVEKNQSAHEGNDAPISGNLSIGPKYWKSKYRKSYRKVEKGLTGALKGYIDENMHLIESYNKNHKLSLSKRVRVNIDRELTWFDVVPARSLCEALLRYLSKRNSGMKSIALTQFQQRFFALMSGNSSIVAKGPSGSGRSLTLLTSALSLRRPKSKRPGINSLLIVKSNALVFQYESIIKEIVSEMRGADKMNIKKIAQFLYRGTPEEERQQEEDLENLQTPHILVTTPQRLLDILSSHGMDFVKIHNLSYIGVDDFTSMIDEELYLESSVKAPVVTLLDFVMKLQDLKKKQKDLNPQVVLIADDSSSENLISNLKEYTKWIDWKFFAPVGNFKEDNEIPFYKYVGKDAAVSTVLVSPRFTEESEKSGKFKVSLHDMRPYEYGASPKQWIDTLNKNSYGDAETYKKYRNSKWSSVPTSVKKGELEILCAGLGKLLKKKTTEAWMKDGKSALVVHPDEYNSKYVAEVLSGKTGKKVRTFDIRNDSLRFSEMACKDSDSEILVLNVSSLIGLTLPGLDTIFVLGVNTIKSVHHLSTIIGRTRLQNGLVPDKEYTLFSQVSQSSTETRPRSRTFILCSVLPYGSLDPFDRNFLERAFITNGLIRQLPAVGVQEIWNEDLQKEYDSAINGPFEDQYSNGTTVFGGLKISGSITDQ